MAEARCTVAGFFMRFFVNAGRACATVLVIPITLEQEHIMMPTNSRCWFLCLIAITFLVMQSAVAGPPLLCHPIEIGEAKSLPWGKDAFGKAKSYDTGKLADDTLAILDSKAPIAVRMETLRRAAVYVDRQRSRADELLGRLMARALDAESNNSKGHALAWFDAGYFAACLNQAGVKTSFGPDVENRSGAATIPGYSWVARAIQLGGGTEMELAAALITVDHRCPEFDQHL